MGPDSGQFLFLLMSLQRHRKERKVTSLTGYAIAAALNTFFANIEVAEM